MGWLASDKEKIRKFLGYPPRSADVNLIQLAMTELQNTFPDAIATAQYHLAQLVKIQDALDSDRPYAATASHSNAGSSTDYYPGQKMGVSREEGARHVRELAELFPTLMVVRDVFALPRSGGARLRKS
jgi:hypothetical protein